MVSILYQRCDKYTIFAAVDTAHFAILFSKILYAISNSQYIHILHMHFLNYNNEAKNDKILRAKAARLSHRNSVCPSVCSSVTRVDQSKTVQARITKFLPSAAWKTLVSGTVKLFHKFEEGHTERVR